MHDDAYSAALRMLWHPQDAEDAMQEALIRIRTRISSYRGESAFRTGVPGRRLTGARAERNKRT